MIYRMDRFRWLVQVGHAEQQVVGPIWDARRIEQLLIRKRATTPEEAEAKRWHAKRRMQPKI